MAITNNYNTNISSKTLEKIKGLTPTIWSDITSGLYIEKDDIQLFYNNDALLQAIFNILFTRKGERVMLCDFGVDLDEYLFEQDINYDRIAIRIKEEILRWEPRIAFIDLTITPTNEPGTIVLNFVYSDISNPQDIKITAMIYSGGLYG